MMEEELTKILKNKQMRETNNDKKKIDLKEFLENLDDYPPLDGLENLSTKAAEETEVDELEDYKTNSHTEVISFLEFAIINQYLHASFRKPTAPVKVINYGHTDNMGKLFYGGSFEATQGWWFQTVFDNDDNEYIFDTKIFMDSSKTLVTELHVTSRASVTFTVLFDKLKEMKKIAFNNSEYCGKCIKIKLKEGRFRAIEIIDMPKSQSKLILTPTQKKYINHFINSVGKGRSIRYLFNGEPGTGKAQPLDAKILTPNGWVTMGDIAINDEVITPDGNISNVIAVYPQGEKEIYKITFADGRSTEACGEHLWKVFNGKKRGEKSWSISNTLEIKSELDNGNKRLKVPLVSENINFNTTIDLVVDAYLMGVLLGDGCFKQHGVSISTSDEEIVTSFKTLLNEKHNLIFDNGYDYIITRKEGKGYKGDTFKNEYVNEISELGLKMKKSNVKFIPLKYKNGSLEQKYNLLQGLMDSDGTVDKSSHISYSTTSYELAKDIQELIWSVGGVCKITNKQTNYTYKGVKKVGQLSYNLSIRHSFSKKLFRLKRKVDLISDNYQYSNSLKNNIVNIEFVGEKEAKCIMIDNENHLYITDNYIVTHNTDSIREIAKVLTPNVTFVIPDFSSTEDLTTILEACEIFEKGVIIMDDIDLYLGSRDNGSYTKLLGEFLSFFDGVKKRKISLLASTNDKGLVDKAAERPGRFNMTLDYTFLTDEQIVEVCEVHLPVEYQVEEVYDVLRGSLSGRKAKITGAFIANLSENIREMSDDNIDWNLKETIDLITESYKGFYTSQVDKSRNNTGFNIN